MVDLDGLNKRMVDHDVINGSAVVILTAKEMFDIIMEVADLRRAVDAAERCCCSIDWDYRCPIHGPQIDDNDDPEEDFS